ncbi:ABC transporter substrate-binding protein, partial [Pseudomonas sp. ATCC 13867]
MVLARACVPHLCSRRRCRRVQAQSQSITVISFGGATKAAQEQAYFKPFEASGAGKIVAGE